jgi:hypothetical protein
MKSIKLIRFIEEPTKLNDLDMNQIRGGQLSAAADCNGYVRCRKYTVTKSEE